MISIGGERAEEHHDLYLMGALTGKQFFPAADVEAVSQRLGGGVHRRRGDDRHQCGLVGPIPVAT